MIPGAGRTAAIVVAFALAGAGPMACAERRETTTGSRNLILVIGEADAFARSRAVSRIAARAVAFPNLLAPSPSRLPTTVTLLTGRTPFEHGVRTEADTMADGTATLAELLREQGWTPVAYGFERSPTRWMRGFGELRSLPPRQTEDTRTPIVDGLAEPFFVLVRIEGDLDPLLESLLGEIARAGLDTRTCLAVCGIPSHAAPNVLDRTLRSPAVLQPPRGAGRAFDDVEPAPLSDLVPTLVEIVAGRDSEALRGLGRSLAEIGGPPREVVAESSRPGEFVRALRRGPWKLVLTFDREFELRSRKLVRPEADPEERTDLTSAHAAVAGGLQARLDALAREDPLPAAVAAARRAQSLLGEPGGGLFRGGLPSPVFLPVVEGPSLRARRRAWADELLRRWIDEASATALEELGALGLAGQDALVRGLATDDPLRLRATLAAARRLAEPDLFPAIFERYLRSVGALAENEPIPLELLVTLDALDRPRLRERLMAAAGDPDPEKRRAAARGFQIVLDDETLERLVGLLEDDSPEVRARAARSLEACADPSREQRAVVSLVNLLDRETRGPEPSSRPVLEAGFEALRTLSGPRSPAFPDPADTSARDAILADPDALRDWLDRFRIWWQEARRGD